MCPLKVIVAQVALVYASILSVRLYSVCHGSVYIIAIYWMFWVYCVYICPAIALV